MHVAQGRLVALGVDLHVLDPDVLPEAQAHHIQVIAPVTESTRQLHKHCPHTTAGLLFHCCASLTPVHDSTLRALCDVTFSVSKVFCVQLYDAVCEMRW